MAGRRSWYWPHLRPNEISWYRQLKNDPEFMKRCRARWAELRKTVFAPAHRVDRMERIVAWFGKHL